MDKSQQKINLTQIAFKTQQELENPALTHINRLPPRSNLIPARKAGVYYKNKEESCLLQNLTGDYQFRYCESDCLSDFYEPELDDSSWDTIDVPSMWQYRGYGKCCYPNVDYPIPFNPPYICCPNPVGYYRRRFEATPGEKTILHFGGVDNAFYVYMNGKFVGMSKGSRNPAEFDVTGLIRTGENLLAVKVFTYSDATYLENQDMLMANGIFRDVYLLHTGKVSLWDYRVTTDLKGFALHLELTEGCPDCTVEIRLGTKACMQADVQAEVQVLAQTQICRRFPAEKVIDTYFAIENPKLWNSEEPYLYNLEIYIVKCNEVSGKNSNSNAYDTSDIECHGDILEIHSKRIGMLHSCVAGNQLLVNGKPIYIKGINRHEYDCNNGRAVSVALIEKELKMIKANNINAIRCSHYTNHPAFYELCSELGIFVMDEADLETHGCSVTGDQGYLSKRKEWLPAYLDRVDRMLKQNKNEACIFMYSMGNEFGQGENLIECLKYTLAYEPNKVAIHDQQQSSEELFELPNKEYDVILRAGYRSAEDTMRLIEAQPISMQIEYAHAMGNSPGFLEGYQKFVYENDSYLGGFVWEFKNHGFHQVDENGQDYYLYGGDFGEKNHWYNFCLDGYLMSDGTPKHSWYELGEVFAPVYVTYDGQIHLKNTYNFRNLDTLTLYWELCEDYKIIKSGQMPMPAAEPHEEVVLDFDMFTDIKSDNRFVRQTDVKVDGRADMRATNHIPGATYYLNLHFYDKAVCTGSHQIKLESSVLWKLGISETSQLTLPEHVDKIPYQSGAFEGSLAQEGMLTKADDRIEEVTSEEGSRLSVLGQDFSVTFENGVLCQYVHQGKNLLDQPFTFNIYRAPTDNDGILGMPYSFQRNAEKWNTACLDTIRFRASDVKTEMLADRAVCRVKGKVLPLAKYYGFDVELEYHIYQNGLIAVHMKAYPYGNFPEKLPRIGLCFPLSREYSQVTWYGRGPRENYSDCKKASPVGLYSKPIQKTYTVFDMPQETGNHENTAFVRLLDSIGAGLTVVGCSEFAFSYHDFTLENLTKACHKNELEKSDCNYLYVDYIMRGLGSHSCGPEPEQPFELRPHAFEFSFVLGGNLSQEQALEFVRTDFGMRTGALVMEETYSTDCTAQEIGLL